MPALNDIYIAVVGHHGAGKSDFIRLCTGKDTGVRNSNYSRMSYTKRIQAWTFVHEGRRIHLLDTSGYYRDDTGDLCGDLQKWLASVERAAISRDTLHGIILMHDITIGGLLSVDGRFMLSKLFSREDPASHNNRLVLATNRWDLAGLKEGQVRESQLESRLWGLSSISLRKNKSVRLDHNKESCLAVLHTLLRQINPGGPESTAEKPLRHQEDINALRQKTASLEQAHQALSTENERYQTACAACTSHIAEKESHETQIAVLKANVEELTKEVADLKAHIAALKANVEGLTKDFAAFKAYIATLKANVEEPTKEVAALKAYIAEAERTATGYWGGVEIPPVPYSLEPPRQSSD